MQYDDVCISVLLGQCLHNTEAKMSPRGTRGMQVRTTIDKCKLFGHLAALQLSLLHWITMLYGQKSFHHHKL